MCVHVGTIHYFVSIMMRTMITKVLCFEMQIQYFLPSAGEKICHYRKKKYFASKNYRLNFIV